MRDFVEQNRVVLMLAAALFCLALMFGYVLGTKNAPIQVSVGDAKVSVGEKNVPLESAISDIYHQTQDLPNLTKDVNYLLHCTRMEMVRNILRQYTAIRENPNQVMIIDVVSCFEDWPQIPQNYKTGDLPIKYEYILSWYQKRTSQDL